MARNPADVPPNSPRRAAGKDDSRRAFRKRRGRTFRGESSGGGDFNRDFDVSFTQPQIQSGAAPIRDLTPEVEQSTGWLRE